MTADEPDGPEDKVALGDTFEDLEEDAEEPDPEDEDEP